MGLPTLWRTGPHQSSDPSFLVKMIDCKTGLLGVIHPPKNKKMNKQSMAASCSWLISSLKFLKGSLVQVGFFKEPLKGAVSPTYFTKVQQHIPAHYVNSPLIWNIQRNHSSQSLNSITSHLANQNAQASKYLPRWCLIGMFWGSSHTSSRKRWLEAQGCR